MSISSSDILLKFATKDGAAGDTTAGTAAGSLGKYISTSEFTSNSLHNLFDVISSTENADEEDEYRCLFIHNNHDTLTFSAIYVYILSQVSGGANIAIGVDTTAASDIGESSAQALEIANENTAPVGVAFSSPTTFETGLSIGDLAPDECRAIWIRRTATDSDAMSNDGVTLRFKGESL